MLQRIFDAGRVLAGQANVTRGRIMSGVGSEAQYKWPNLAEVKNQKQQFLDSALVYIAIMRILLSIGVIEFIASKDGVRLKEYWLLDLLAKPNSWMSQFELIAFTFGEYFITGNSYWYRNGRKEIIPLRSDRVRIVAGPDTESYIRGYVYTVNSRDIPLLPEDVMHNKMYHPLDDFYGLSPLIPAALPVQADLAMSRWNRGYFGQNNGVPPNMVSLDPTVTDTEFERLQEDWSRNYSTNNRERKTAFIRGGAITYTDLSKNQKEMEFISGRKFNKEEVMLIFGIPPGVLDVNATEANALAGKEVFTEQTLWPNLVLFAQKLTATFTQAEGVIIEPRDIRVKDATAMLREMQATSPIMSVDEQRAKYFDMEPATWPGHDKPATGADAPIPSPGFGKPNIDKSPEQIRQADQNAEGSQSAASPFKSEFTIEPVPQIAGKVLEVDLIEWNGPRRAEKQQFYRYASKGKSVERFTFQQLPRSIDIAYKAQVDINELDYLTVKAILPASSRVSINGVRDPNAKEKEQSAKHLAAAFASAFGDLQGEIVDGVKHVAADGEQPYLDHFDNRWWKAALAAFVSALYATYYDLLESAAQDQADISSVQSGVGFDDASLAPMVKDAVDSWTANWLPGIMQTTRAAFEAMLSRWASAAIAKISDLVSAVQESPVFGEDRATLAGETENTALWMMAAYLGVQVVAGSVQGVDVDQLDDISHPHPGCVCFVDSNLVWNTLKDGHNVCPVCDGRDGKTVQEIVEGGL